MSCENTSLSTAIGWSLVTLSLAVVLLSTSVSTATHLFLVSGRLRNPFERADQSITLFHTMSPVDDSDATLPVYLLSTICLIVLTPSSVSIRVPALAQNQ